MSSFLGATRALAMLEKLRTVVRDAVAREEKINTDFRVRTTKERQYRDRGISELIQEITARRTRIDEEYSISANAVESRIARRKDRLERAHDACRAKTFGEVDNWENGWKFRLQKDELQSHRTRDADIASAENNFAEFNAAFAMEQNAFVALEEKARDVFSGYPKFLRYISHPAPGSEPDLAPDEHQLIKELRALLGQLHVDLKRFNRMLLPLLSRWLWFVAIVGLGVLGLTLFLAKGITPMQAGKYFVGFFAVMIVLHFIGQARSGTLAMKIAGALEHARRLLAACTEKSQTRHHNDLERAENEFKQRAQSTQLQWEQTEEEGAQRRSVGRTKVETKARRAFAKFAELSEVRRGKSRQEYLDSLARLEAEANTRQDEIDRGSQEKEARFAAERDEQWRLVEADWRNCVPSVYEAVALSSAAAEKSFPPWTAPGWTTWTAPAEFAEAAKFGQLDVALDVLAESMPKDPRLKPPGPLRFNVPLLLSYPRDGSILIETRDSGRNEAIGSLNDIVLRLLSIAPPGRVRFTVVDPVGLGESFAGVMHLADYGEHLIDSRIWTQTAQIEQKLADLNEHIEKVIQMYLRNEYETIAEYNEQAGNIAEKYHFLIIADFPVNFSEMAVKRLLSIAASGARCGVYTLIHWDLRHQAPQNFVPDDLRKTSFCLTLGAKNTFTGKFFPGTTLTLESPPSADFVTGFIHKAGRLGRDANRVEVPFQHVAPPEAEVWSLETAGELRVPIGRAGATKLQYLAIGKGTRQHGLVAGKTGSGKSTLFHVIITNLALWCSPEQVEFYLVDFKKGVEFKCYGAKHLPHARVVAIESDREFGLSVLQRIDAELKRRGDLFRDLGVQDVAGYKKAGGKEPIPRSLLIIDEFQEFFVEDDRVSQGASVLLDRIVRQGRAFGIHALLGSQTLGGAYSMARATLGQMVIRIALMCNEADAYLIMDDNNPAPRLLSRPGEGIYNDTAGTMEGNSPFQCVWISDDERDAWLDKVRAKADASGKSYPAPIVFEGDAPSDIAENPLLRDLLAAPTLVPAPSPNIWLGAPNSIKGPTEATFHRQSGNNLIIVGQHDEAALAILSVALISLAAQHARGRARFVVLDGSPPESPQREYLSRVARAIPHDVTLVKSHEVGEVIAGLAAELKHRTEDEHGAEAPSVFLVINGLQRFTKLRFEEDFGFSSGDEGATPKPGTQLNELICEGTSLGFHMLLACDTYNNVNRCLSKKAFSEFEMRILFQMSANDSASLIDNPKASTLGLHRALFYNEQQGYLEVFRPYAPPGEEWLARAEGDLKRLVGAGE